MDCICIVWILFVSFPFTEQVLPARHSSILVALMPLKPLKFRFSFQLLMKSSLFLQDPQLLLFQKRYQQNLVMTFLEDVVLLVLGILTRNVLILLIILWHPN